MVSLWILLAGCTADAERLLVVDGREGVYDLVERAVPELTDPGRMRGTLGDGTVAGAFLEADGDIWYEGGGTVRVDHVVQDGVGVPTDADGLTLWSYYHTLSALKVELEDLGIPVEPVFPVPFAYQPSLGLTTDVTENAAYVGGGVHHFILLADPTGARLPLAANPLVIRHEFGHALFHDRVHGSKDAYDTSIASIYMRHLNEGFADMVATLLLDDPDVLGASFDDSTDRRVDGDAVTLEPDPVDPYSRGTVYASLAWDVRTHTDPGFALRHAVETLEVWKEHPGIRDSDRADDITVQDDWATLYIDRVLADRPEHTDALCSAHATRFPDQPEPTPCGS